EERRTAPGRANTMRTAVQTAVIGFMLIGLAACGGSGGGSANRQTDVASGPAACADGSCTKDPGGGDESSPPPRTCGGAAGQTCPDGYTCVGSAGAACDPATGNADCAGTCEPSPQPQCRDDADCPVGGPCSQCADGSAACPKAACEN